MFESQEDASSNPTALVAAMLRSALGEINNTKSYAGDQSYELDPRNKFDNPRHLTWPRPTIAAFADDHNHHLPLCWAYFQSLVPETTSAHQPSMGDHPSNSGEAAGPQSSCRDRGAPVAFGMVSTHTVIHENGPNLHHLGRP